MKPGPVCDRVVAYCPWPTGALPLPIHRRVNTDLQLLNDRREGQELAAGERETAQQRVERLYILHEIIPIALS